MADEPSAKPADWLSVARNRREAWSTYARFQFEALSVGADYWREAEAWLGRNDLFYLLTRILRREDLNKDWLFDRCREVQRAPDGHLDLWAREHGKSSVITFGLTVQDILRDPEVTVGIFSHTRPVAKTFLRQIKVEFETNDVLKALYPDVLWQAPHKESPKWSEDDGIVVKRKGNPKEATVEAWGLVDGQPTGRHFRLRVYDDVVTRESVTTPEMVQKVTDAWDLSQNLGVQEEQGGKVRYIGTRYSLHDTYAEMIRRRSAIPRLYPATHNGRLDGKPVLFSEAEWGKRVRDSRRSILAAQMLQNPLAEEDAVFQTAWLKAYEVRPRTLNVYVMCDPSRGRSATSDNTAIAVVGISATGAKFLLDGACHRMTLSQRWQMLRTFYRRWSAAPGVQHVAVGYERFGAQSDDEYFQEQMRLEREFFVIEELNWPREGGSSKRERIERLEPDFRGGRFFLPLPVLHDGTPCTWQVESDPDAKDVGTVTFPQSRGLTRRQMDAIKGGAEDLVARAIVQRDPELPAARSGGGRYDLTVKLIEDFQVFPFGRHDDLLDAVSRIYDMDPRAPLAPSSRNEIVNTYVDGV